MAKSAGIDKVLGVAMGNRAAPWCGIRRRSRRMRQIDIMAVLAAVDQRADLGVETRIAACSARSRCMTSFTEDQILFCCRAVQGRIGKGECVRHRTGNMGVRMAYYAVEAAGGTAYPGYPTLASLL